MEIGLPVVLTSFVGRETELVLLDRLLRNEPVVTLTGPGGSGKTRLAVEVAGRWHHRTARQDVWFVDLSALSTSAPLHGVIAHATGAPRDGSYQVLDLVAHLRRRRGLLILDNCEHLVDEVARVVLPLARQCDALRICVTSREPLRIEGESILRVGALPAVDASRLFCERAIRADASFRCQGSTTACVASICRRLDGIPLAIELAAACVGSMTPERILDELDDRFRILVGHRAAAPRHRTMREALEWSEGLLSDVERCLYRRLGVFVGGFTLEAAEAVVSDPELPVREILPLLRRLVERSLVQLEGGEGWDRYRLLETVRMLAAERLTACGEIDVMRERHASYFAEISLRAADAWIRIGLPDFSALERERANLRQALVWARSARSPLFTTLAAGMTPLFLRDPRADDGRHWLQEALDTPPLAPRVRYRLLWALGWLTMLVGDAQASVRHNFAAVQCAEELDDQSELVNVLSHHADVLLRTGDLAASRRQAERAVQLGRRMPDTRQLTVALSSLTEVRLADGDTAGALEAAREAYEHALDSGEAFRVLRHRTLLARVLLRAGSVDDAIATLQSGTQADQPLIDLDLRYLAMTATALIAAGHLDHGLRLAGSVDANCERYGFGRARIWAWGHEATEQAIGRDRRARHAYMAGHQMTIGQARAFALQTPGSRYAGGVDLTAREIEVAHLIRDGLSDHEIADRLVISVRTAESHVASLRSKLSMRSRTQVAVWVSENLHQSD